MLPRSGRSLRPRGRSPDAFASVPRRTLSPSSVSRAAPLRPRGHSPARSPAVRCVQWPFPASVPPFRRCAANSMSATGRIPSLTRRSPPSVRPCRSTACARRRSKRRRRAFSRSFRATRSMPSNAIPSRACPRGPRRGRAALRLRLARRDRAGAQYVRRRGDSLHAPGEGAPRDPRGLAPARRARLRARQRRRARKDPRRDPHGRRCCRGSRPLRAPRPAQGRRGLRSQRQVRRLARGSGGAPSGRASGCLASRRLFPCRLAMP